MLRLLLFIPAAAILFGQAPPLPPRFALPSPGPVIRKTAQPAKFIESVGRRGALLGREDGTFEAWINPLKLVGDFRLAAYFDGSLEPVPLADLAERLEVSPGRVTLVHSHAAFTVRQTWVAALDEPLLLVLLDIDTARPLRIRASFLPEMKPMWPASFGGQSSWFDEDDRAVYLGEGLRRFYGFVGSPAFARSSEQVGHQLPDRTLLVEMDVTPEAARDHLIPIVIGCAPKLEAARKLYREALPRIPAMLAASDAYYRRFEQRTLFLSTPDPVINHAWEWAKYALEKGWVCNEGVGCGLVAGWGPSGNSQRPGFAWYFGGDALMNSWSILDYGDLARVRGVLEFLRAHQRADGKLPHELTQSAALLDWSQYPYGYYHGDTTPLYLFTAARYVERSGDLEFLEQSWDSIERAWRAALAAADSDGLLLNRKAGAAAVETGALSGRVEKDVYLQGVWLAAIDSYLRLTRMAAGLTKIAPRLSNLDEIQRRLDQARASLGRWFSASQAWLPFGRLTDGSTYDALSGWQSFALGWAGLDPEKAQRAAATLNRPELSSDWGTRLFSTDSPHYDPLSYNDGSVWPFVTGFAIMAEYRNHRAAAALQHLHGVAAMTDLAGAGFLTEYLSGDRAQALPRAVPHQLFSSSAVVYTLVSGLLGLDGNALTGTLTLEPHLPPAWPKVEFSRYAFANHLVSGTLTRSPGCLKIRLDSGEPIRLRFAPAVPAGSSVRAILNGQAVPVILEASLWDAHAVVETPPLAQAVIEIHYSGSDEPMPELVEPLAGDRSRARRSY